MPPKPYLLIWFNYPLDFMRMVKLIQAFRGILIGIFVLSGVFGSPVLRAEELEVAPRQVENQILTTPDYTGDLLTRSTLTGDWAGRRQALANHGVTIDGNLTQVEQGVISGGVDEGWEYMGRGELTLNVDTAKMSLWPGGLLTVMGEGNFGTPLNSQTGSLIGVNTNDLLPEPANSFVLPQVTFTQFFSPEFGITVGKFATIGATGGDQNEFAHGKGNDQFLNLAFNINPVSALTVPYSTLGISAVFLPTKDFVGALTVLDPHGKADSAGFDTLFANGATFAIEGRYTTRFFAKKGHQLLGATFSTSDYADLDQRVVNLIIPNLPTKEANQSWAIYWNADQYFFQPDPLVDRGLGVFARFGVSDGEANPIGSFASAGIGGKGMIPEREHDGCGMGYFYSWVASNRVTSELGFEDAQGFEAYYEAALTPALRVTPNIQWIEPSQERVDPSWNVGVRLYAAF